MRGRVEAQAYRSVRRGVLTLDRPITEVYGKERAYQRLYAVRIGGQECLLPEVAVGGVEESLSRRGKPFAPSSAESDYAFRRARPKKPAER